MIDLTETIFHIPLWVIIGIGIELLIAYVLSHPKGKTE